MRKPKGGLAGGRHTSARTASEINMVPFTDVVLVLLVIFMITTPLLIQGQIKVKLPRAASAPETQAPPPTVIITAEGRVYIKDQEVLVEQLPTLLRQQLALTSDKTVIISADRAATHGKVVQVLDAAKQAGAEKLGIATDQSK
jgi:biopolymer transport protein TolR